MLRASPSRTRARLELTNEPKLRDGPLTCSRSSRSQPDDLGFSAGDIITIEEEVNTDWWKGSISALQLRCFTGMELAC